MIHYMVHPKHGKMPVYNQQMIEHNRQFGWELEDAEKHKAQVVPAVESGDVAKTSPETSQKDQEDSARNDACKSYRQKFGRSPHHRMKTETILKALNDGA